MFCLIVMDTVMELRYFGYTPKSVTLEPMAVSRFSLADTNNGSPNLTPESSLVLRVFLAEEQNIV